MKNILNNIGFSLLSLMITVVLIVILSTLVFLWIDPLAQTGAAKDNARVQAVNVLAVAIKQYSNEHSGALPVLGSITTSSKKVLCSTQSGASVDCGLSSEACLRIADPDFYTYIHQLPIDPDKTSEQDTGYYLQKDNVTGQLIVGVCNPYDTAINKTFGLKVSCDAYAGGYCWKISDTASQNCNSVCSANGLTCVESVSYGPDVDCALNLGLATSSTACDTSCSSGSIVGNYPSATSCYYNTGPVSCTATVTSYLNICPCQ